MKLVACTRSSLEPQFFCKPDSLGLVLCLCFLVYRGQDWRTCSGVCGPVSHGQSTTCGRPSAAGGPADGSGQSQTILQSDREATVRLSKAQLQHGTAHKQASISYRHIWRTDPQLFVNRIFRTVSPDKILRCVNTLIIIITFIIITWAIVEKSLSKRGGKLYTCFVDVKKAFHSVQRGPLFNILCQNGLSGKFLNALGAI